MGLRRCEALASFASACRKHAPAALRCHSRFESVVAFATAVVRLKCAFHELLCCSSRHQKMRPAQKQLLIIDPHGCQSQHIYDSMRLCSRDRVPGGKKEPAQTGWDRLQSMQACEWLLPSDRLLKAGGQAVYESVATELLFFRSKPCSIWCSSFFELSEKRLFTPVDKVVYSTFARLWMPFGARLRGPRRAHVTFFTCPLTVCE